MPREYTNDLRFRFMEEHQLSVTWYDSGASITWREKRPAPGKTAGYRPVSRGRTLAAAIDIAIAKWEKQHGSRYGP
jgi:hypothetical protein